jgi:hypothetical protein
MWWQLLLVPLVIFVLAPARYFLMIRLRGGGCARSKPAEFQDVARLNAQKPSSMHENVAANQVVTTALHANDEASRQRGAPLVRISIRPSARSDHDPGGESTTAAVFVQTLNPPAAAATPENAGTAPKEKVLLLPEPWPMKAVTTADATVACSSSEARVSLAPGVVVVIDRAKSTTRHAVADAIEDAEVENDDFGEATPHELPGGGWLFEAVNDPEPGLPIRFDVSARLVIDGQAYTAMASVGTLAHQAMASEFCRRLTSSSSSSAAALPEDADVLC